MHRRLNITLPEETVRLLDRVAGKGERSFVIAEAVAEYVTRKHQKEIRRLIREGSRVNAARDLAIAEEWAQLDDGPPPKRKRK